jgi:MFS family permease
MSTNTSSRDDRSFSGPALLVAGAFFMEFLDGTVIATALPDMAKDFGVTAVDLNIGISAYLITLAVLIPASGWIADRFGARKIFTLALAIFTLASVFCGLSTHVDVFVAMRILQGIGGALMVPVGRLAVLRTTPKHQLIKAIATLTWPALVAPLLARRWADLLPATPAGTGYSLLTFRSGLSLSPCRCASFRIFAKMSAVLSICPAFLPPRWR